MQIVKYNIFLLMQTDKNKLKNLIISCLDSEFTDIPEHIRQKIANKTTEICLEFHNEINKELKIMYNELSLSYERNRTLYTEQIDYMKKMTEKLMEVYNEKGVVKVEYDSALGKNVMKFRTTMLEETVVYMNKLNDLVIQYYKEVMKEKKKEFTIMQSSLF